MKKRRYRLYSTTKFQISKSACRIRFNDKMIHTECITNVLTDDEYKAVYIRYSDKNFENHKWERVKYELQPNFYYKPVDLLWLQDIKRCVLLKKYHTIDKFFADYFEEFL